MTLATDIASLSTGARVELFVLDATPIGGAAFCPFHWLTEAPGGGVPLTPDTLCGANIYNHPGPLEYSYYGAALCRLFD